MISFHSTGMTVSVSQNNYTSKQGFMSLMLIQTVKLKFESDMSLEEEKTC